MSVLATGDATLELASHPDCDASVDDATTLALAVGGESG
jgi:hypothetical protein